MYTEEQEKRLEKELNPEQRAKFQYFPLELTNIIFKRPEPLSHWFEPIDFKDKGLGLYVFML